MIRSGRLILREQMVNRAKGQIRRLKTAPRWKIPALQGQRIETALPRESKMPRPSIAAAMGVPPGRANLAPMAYDQAGARR